MAKMTKLIKVSKIRDFKWGDCQWYTFRRSEPYMCTYIQLYKTGSTLDTAIGLDKVQYDRLTNT